MGTALRFIPNIITMSNLFVGCLGVVWAFNSELDLAVRMIWLCAILDVMDGLAARAVGVGTELGKQLDSLADLISFGLLPSTILYLLWMSALPSPWALSSFLITVFSALRLAKFNLDPDQTTNFKGLPTPANALLISSFPAIFDQNQQILRLGSENQLVWFLLVGLLCYLLVSNFRLIGFKFRDYSWEKNKFRYIILGGMAILVTLLGSLGIPWVFLWYLGVSLVWQRSQVPTD